MATRFDIDPATHDAAKRMLGDSSFPRERIAEELRKLFTPRTAARLRLLREMELVEAILPELAAR